MERFHLTAADIADLRVESITLRLGTEPSTALLRRELIGPQATEPPDEIEILSGETCVFCGYLATRTIEVNCDEPHQTAEYLDARHALSRMAFPPQRVLRNGLICVEDDGDTVFNPSGEANKAPEFLAFSSDPADVEPWTGLDVLKYLAEYSFCCAPSCTYFTIQVDSLDEGVRRRLAAYRPSSLGGEARSPYEVMCRVLAAVGAEATLDFSVYPPRFQAMLPYGPGRDGIELDAGIPGGDILPEDPPEVYGYKLVGSSDWPPVEIVADGLTLKLETSHTLLRRMTATGYETCRSGEGDLVPGWEKREEDLFHWLRYTDPTETRSNLDPLRESVWRVFRLYRLNPDLDFGAFFSLSGTPFDTSVCESFARNQTTSLPPEVTFLDAERNRWTIPVDEFGQFVGATLAENGKAVLFDKCVSIGDTQYVDVVKVGDIAFSICLVARQRQTIGVRADEVFGPDMKTGRDIVVRRSGYSRRIAADVGKRSAWRCEYPLQRDDRSALEMDVWSEMERRRPFDEFECRLHGMRSDIQPGTLIDSLTFEKGAGEGCAAWNVNSVVRTVVLLPREFGTLLLCGGPDRG